MSTLEPIGTGGRPAFTHHADIAVSRSRLHAFLCDLDHYVPLHPLIESITELDRLPGLPNARRYSVVDRVSVGPFRMKAVYIAALDPVSDSEVHGHAWQSPGVRLTTAYLLSDGDEGRRTHVEENVYVSAPFGLRRFVVSQASSSHATTLEKLKALLESEPFSAD